VSTGPQNPPKVLLAADQITTVEVLIASGTPAPLALKQATTTTPIVMLAAGDPVGTGLVTSLAQPGGNVTGLSTYAPELAEKRLELLTQVVPEVSRVAFLWNPANPFTAKVAKATERAAQALGVTLLSLEVRNAKGFERAFEAAITERADALLVQDAPLMYLHRTQIIEFAATHRLPALYGRRRVVLTGGLMAYAVDLRDLFRRAATYVDKILQGAKPADLPVEQPTKFMLVINMKTAKDLGLTIPPLLLFQADEVIR
jgi:putative ABC transport system substrate-binding protein